MTRPAQIAAWVSSRLHLCVVQKAKQQTRFISHSLVDNMCSLPTMTQKTDDFVAQFPNVHYSKHPLIADKVAQLRDTNTSPKEFRKLISEIGVLLSYECTRNLELETKSIETPLCSCQVQRIKPKLALVPVLRAGLGMVEGFLSVLPEARVIHVGLARDEETLEPVEYYKKLPCTCDCDIALILDPMLATGGTAIATIRRMKEWGVKHVKFMCILASHVGIEKIVNTYDDVEIYCAGIDEALNEKGYIVPGLGDAGDRQYNSC